jgi:hypothetical protein
MSASTLFTAMLNLSLIMRAVCELVAAYLLHATFSFCCILSYYASNCLHEAEFFLRRQYLRQEISRRSYNSELYYPVHKNPPMVPALSQMNQVHTLMLFFKIILNIILPSLSRPHK